MKRLFWLVLIGSMAVLCSAGVCIEAWEAWRARIVDASREAGEEAALVVPPPAVPQGQPKLVIDKTEYDFGVVDRQATVEHVFVVRNKGIAPLELAPGPTTCKCTLSDLPDRTVLPDREGRIVVSLKPTEKDGPFGQAATIHTNDPDHRNLELRIVGSIYVRLGVTPEEIVFSGIQPKKAENAESLVYSQVWPNFTITKIESSRAGLTCSAEPASPLQLKEQGARAGYRIRIGLSGDLPTGPFSETVKIDVDPRDGATPRQTRKITVAGEVSPRIEMSGAKLRFDNVLELGALRRGETIREQLLLVLRDEPRQIAVQRIERRPEFLRVHVAPLSSEQSKRGVYRIDVEVPPDAPPSDFVGVNRGEIVIVTNHPRVPRLKIKVDLAVLSN